MNPAAGTFLQRDPLGYVDGMNLYVYVKGNPLMYMDPYGSDSWITSWFGLRGTFVGNAIDDATDVTYEAVAYGDAGSVAFGVSGIAALSAAADSVISNVTSTEPTIAVAVGGLHDGLVATAYGTIDGITLGLFDLADVPFQNGYLIDPNDPNLRTSCSIGQITGPILTLGVGGHATSVRGFLFGRGRYRGGSPGIFNRGNPRIGWGYNDATKLNTFGFHGNRPRFHDDWISVPQWVVEWIW
ncbi:MAG: hypothetical protein C0475_04425 [Planctomyces sp.]|nr:hypothetical protein [Planctomyces sp.]